MKINKFLCNFIGVLSGSICVILFILNVVFINNMDNQEYSHIERYGILYLEITLCIIFAILFFIVIASKIRINRTISIIAQVFLIGMYAVVQFVWVYYSCTLPYADSEQIMVISRGFINPELLSRYCVDYLSYYPQQITLAAVFTSIFRIMNSTNYKIIEYLNVISNVFTIVGLYFITKRLSNKYLINKKIFYLLALSFVPLVLLSTFVYGDFIGLAFVVWAVYFAISKVEKNKILYGIIAGVLIAISCLFRMNYIIVAIAVVIYWMLDLINKKGLINKQNLFKIVTIILFVSIVFLPGKIVKKVYTNKYNLDAEKSFSTIPYLYMGISEGDRGFGWYNNEMGDRVYHMMSDSKDEANNVSNKCKEDFKNRVTFMVHHPIYTIKFYAKKIISMWAEPTMGSVFYNSYCDNNVQMNIVQKSLIQGKINKIIKIYQKCIMFIIFVGSGIVALNVKKGIMDEVVLLFLIFLGGFFFHVLWEAKSRYIIPYYIILIPIASVGITALINRAVDISRNKLNRKVSK